MREDTCHTLNIAHRGARSLAPENTLAAARKALEAGADMWELDVAMTADGVPFLVHDDTLERTSNAAVLFPERKPWPAHTFSLAEIRRLDFGSWYKDEDPFGQIKAGHVSQADLAGYEGLPAPTLREALVFTRDHDWRVNVEIKDVSGTPGDRVIAEQVAGLIEELGLVERVLVSSFNHSYLERVKAANPAVATGALVQLPVLNPAGLVRRLGAQAYHPFDKLIRTRTVTRLRNQGIDVFVWTVNDAKRMRALIQANTSGIVTDFPQVLAPILDACS